MQASGEVGESHDALRLGLDAGVKGARAPAPGHPRLGTAPRPKPLEEARFWEEKKRIGDEAVYWSAFNIRKDVDAQILFRFQRPPGALPSSMLGYEALTGSLDDFGFEDYLNVPQDSENFHPPDTHHGMEVRLGLSKGPICPSFS